MPNLKRIQQQMTQNLTVKTFHEKEALNVLNLHISFFQKSEANTARNHLIYQIIPDKCPSIYSRSFILNSIKEISNTDYNCKQHNANLLF